MKTLTITLAVMMLASCKKEEAAQPTPPAPVVPPYVCCPTTAPNLLSPSDAASLTLPITWRWSKVEGAAKYYLRAVADWNGNNAVVANLVVVTDTFYVQTTLPTIPIPWSGAQGEWKVQGLSTDNIAGPWSEARSFTIQ